MSEGILLVAREQGLGQARLNARAQRLSNESRDYAWAIQTLAERRAAQFLEQLERGKGDVDKRSKNHSAEWRSDSASDYRRGLDEIGISHQEASRWRTVAEVHETAVSNYVAAVAVRYAVR